MNSSVVEGSTDQHADAKVAVGAPALSEGGNPLASYALVSPARNEADYIAKTIESMIGQTHKPVRWVVVDDGSSDRTAEIVQSYQNDHPWIELVLRPADLDRSFAGKVHAFNAGRERLEGLDYDVLGNLDADLSFGPDYLGFLMGKFADDPKLGVAGTPFTQDDGYDSAVDSFEGCNYVAGGCQLFRRECFEEVGGYVPNKAGGVDWMAVMSARMKGWTVRSFDEMRFHHYRTLGTAEMNELQAISDYGKRAYFLGGSPVWQLVRCAYRVPQKPYVLGAAALGWGYFWASLRRVKRPVSREMIRFHRKDQMRRLGGILKAKLRGQKIDAFRTGN